GVLRALIRAVPVVGNGACCGAARMTRPPPSRASPVASATDPTSGMTRRAFVASKNLSPLPIRCPASSGQSWVPSQATGRDNCQCLLRQGGANQLLGAAGKNAAARIRGRRPGALPAEIRIGRLQQPGATDFLVSLAAQMRENQFPLVGVEK